MVLGGTFTKQSTMEETPSDADFLSLLEEIERSDGHAETGDDKTPDPSDLIDLFIGEVEHLVTPPIDPSLSGPASGANASSSASHAERCRVNRKRKKQELHDLRTVATTLEATLATLTQRHTNSQATDWSLVSSWRELSRRTKLQSRQALAENKALRELLVNQWVATQQIQQAIRFVPKLESIHWDSRSLKRPREEPAMAPTSRRKYHELFQNIHSSYENDDFHEELAWIKIGARKISMDIISQLGGGTDTSIRVLECQRLPFSLSYLQDATWRHLSTPCDGSTSEGDEMCDRTALTSFGDDMFGECGAECNVPPGNDAIPPGRLAIRRYVETNRLTLVWECDGCFQCDGSRRPIGRVTERGWCTIEPSEDNTPSTVFRIQVQYVPHASDPATSGCCSSRTTLSSDVALDLYRRTIARTFGAVDRQVFHFDNQKCERKMCQ